MTTIKNIIHELESTFPLAWQESYDNSGLQLGSLSAPVTGILYALECTEEIVQEAIEKDLKMAESLKSFSSSEVLIQFAGEVKPFVIKGNLDQDLLHLILPVRID